MKDWMAGNKPATGNNWNGTLGNDVRLEGTLEVGGTFRIDGEVKGTVRSKDQLVIAENARIQGDIDGRIISIAGKVNGNVRGSDRVEILPSGIIEGEVHAGSLVIEAGGLLEGACHMSKNGKPASQNVLQSQRVVSFAAKEAKG